MQHDHSSPLGEPVYSLVIPAFDEAILIESTLQSVADYLQQQGLMQCTEVVVVAAQGSDNTAELASRNASLFREFRLVEPGPKAGKGRDVKAGVLAARGEYIVFFDADLATPLEHLMPLLHKLESGEYGVVIGVRNLWLAHRTLRRKIMSVASNWMVRLLLLPWVPDSQCGFKGFSRHTAQELFSRMTIDGWAFDMELLAIARQQGIGIGKVPIRNWRDPKLEAGLVGESPMSASMRTLRELFRIRRQRKAGLYK